MIAVPMVWMIRGLVLRSSLHVKLKSSVVTLHCFDVILNVCDVRFCQYDDVIIMGKPLYCALLK